MISLGVTGGIGCGKTYVCRILEKQGVPVFYTDAEAQREMLENTSLQQTLCNIIGKPVVSAEGLLDKRVISSYISQGEDYAQRVNAVVHPAVRRRMQRWLQEQDARISAVECALLFESGYDDDVDYTIVVDAPLDVKIKRVMERDGHSADHVRKIMALQMADDKKKAMADFVIVNDGLTPLEPQLDFLKTLA